MLCRQKGDGHFATAPRFAAKGRAIPRQDSDIWLAFSLPFLRFPVGLVICNRLFGDRCLQGWTDNRMTRKQDVERRS